MLSEGLDREISEGRWQACRATLDKMALLSDTADYVTSKRWREVIEAKRADVDREMRKWKDRSARLASGHEDENEGTMYRDEERRTGKGNPEAKELMIAMHHADQAIDEAISLRAKIRDQGERLLGIADRVDAMMEELPGIGSLIKKINRLDLRNQLIIHSVFYMCLYCLITSAI